MSFLQIMILHNNRRKLISMNDYKKDTNKSNFNSYAQVFISLCLELLKKVKIIKIYTMLQITVLKLMLSNTDIDMNKNWFAK